MKHSVPYPWFKLPTSIHKNTSILWADSSTSMVMVRNPLCTIPTIRLKWSNEFLTPESYILLFPNPFKGLQVFLGRSQHINGNGKKSTMHHDHNPFKMVYCIPNPGILYLAVSDCMYPPQSWQLRSIKYDA